MGTKALTILLASIVLIIVIELIRREKLTFKYALGWLFVSLLAIFLCIFDKWLFQLARFFGFELASNFIFFTLLTVFGFMSLMLTLFLCQQNNRNDAIAQKLGNLESDIEELKNKTSKGPDE